MPGSTEPGSGLLLDDPTALGRLLSRVEADPLAAGSLVAGLPRPQAAVHRIGFTGSPGVGKSTLLAALVPLWVRDGERVGIVAVDPTSAISGGAVLGDRHRWAGFDDSRVFIRSLASRGSLGGLSPAAAGVTAVLEAAGCSLIVIETVGVGQTGSEVLALADTVVVLASPEGGDSLQMLKAGLPEFGDIFVVNKSDRPGADATLKDLRQALHGASRDWDTPVLKATATEGAGTDEIADAITAHRSWLAGLAQNHPRRTARRMAELGLLLRAQALECADRVLGEMARSETVVDSSGLNVWKTFEVARQQLAEACKSKPGTS